MTDTPAPAPEPTPTAAKAKKKRRTWWQRFKLLAIVLLIGVCVFRIVLNVALPTVIDKVAGLYGLDVGYRRLELSLSGGQAHLWGLELRPKEGGDAILNCDYLQGDLSLLELFRGRLVVYRAEVDGADVTIERAADGSLPLLRKFVAAQKAAPPATQKAAGAPRPFSLAAPLQVDAVRLSHLTAHLRDLSVTPAFEATVRTTLRVSDVGSASAPTKFELDVNVDPLVDVLRVTGEARLTPASSSAAVQVLMRGLHPKAAAGYLTPLGLKPVANYVTAQANLTARVDTAPNTADLRATLALDHVSAVADGEQWASLSALTLDAKRVNAATAELGVLSLQDGTASARRTVDGRVQFAGLELAPADAAGPATRPATAPTARPAAAAGPGFAVTLDGVSLRRLAAKVTDAAVSPAATLLARLDALDLGRLDPSSPKPVPLSLSAAVPGVVRSATVVGTVTPFAPAKSVTLRVAADGLRPDLLRPYLDRLGVSSRLTDARFAADLTAAVTPGPDGGVAADLTASGVRLTDPSAPPLAMDLARFTGLSYAPAGRGAVGVKSVELTGPTLTVTRLPDGRLASSGFELSAFAQAPHAAAGASVSTGHPAVPAAPAAASPAVLRPARAAPFALPAIDVGRVNWSGVKLTLRDEAAAAPTSFTIDNAGLRLDGLRLDLQSKEAARPGSFYAYVAAPGLAGDLSARGTFTPDPGRFTAEAEIAGDGLDGTRLAPYVRPLGIEPTLTAGRVHAKAKAVLTQTGDRLGVDLDLNDAVYADGDRELAGVDALRLAGLGLSATRIDVDTLHVRRPRVRVAREADGALAAVGVRVRPTTRPAGSATVAAKPATAPAGFALAALPIELGVKSLEIEDAAIDVTDALAPFGDGLPVTLHAAGGVTLDGLNVAPDAKPTPFHATAAVTGSLRSATVDGTLGLSPLAPSADLTVTADGLAAGPLAAYLPPTLRPTLRDGHFETRLSAGVQNAPDGGLGGHVTVADLALLDDSFPPPLEGGGRGPRDGAAATHSTSPSTAKAPHPNPLPQGERGPDAASSALLKVDAFTASATRLDPAAGVYAVDELSSRGVVLSVTRTPEGRIESCGVRIDPAAPSPARPADAAAQPAAPTTAPAVDLATLVGDARKPLPLVTVQKLDLGLARLAVAGFTGPDAAPVVLRDARLTAPGGVKLGGRRAFEDAALVLTATGGVEPVVGQFDVSLSARPFVNEPSVALDVKAVGLRGDGLTAVLPQLKPTLDGGGLNDGTFTTHLDATVNYGRRGPRDFDLGRGFTAEFTVQPLELRRTPDGPIDLGVKQVRGEGIKAEPANGNLRVRSLEVNTPTFRVDRDDVGLHLAGLTVPLSPQTPIADAATTQPTDEPASGATTLPVAPPPDRPAAPAQRPPNEIRLDHLTVTGIDATIADRTSRPPTVVPLKSLDVDVRDVSNQLPWNGKPVRFGVLVTGGKVPLPPRRGIKGAATTEPAEGSYTEDRELFSQVTADGKIGFVRRGDGAVLDGWAKTAVNGFELLGVRGLAKQYGVTVGGGSFDDTNDVRFDPAGTIETKNRLVFTNLSLSEPANGPLRKLLKLPTPIDVALAAVRDPDGSITLNLPVPVKNGTISTGDVLGPALGAVTNVLVTGIASAPVKAVTGMGNLLGLKGKDAAPEAPVTLGFLPGYDGLDADTRATLGRLVNAMRADDTLELQLRPTLTDADVARVALRANPTPEQCLALAAQVRQEKADLLLRHETLVAQARGDVGAADAARAGASLAELADVDARLDRAEKSLDELYALTGPGAARQADRRTRLAALAVGRRRLEAVHDALAASGVPSVDTRVHQTNPQFDPVASADGGDVTVTLVRKKH